MANQNLSQFGEKLFVADADHTFIWDSAASISKRVSRNSWLSGTNSNCRLGLADAASPVAQTLSVQSVVAGTTNTAGAAFTIDGSQGTGTGAGGALIFRTAPAGSSGATQNDLATAMLITADSRVVPTKITIDGNLGPIEIFNDLATAQGRTFPARSATIGRQGICYRADAQMAWSPGNGSTVDGGNFGTADTILVRDSASGNTLGLRNGINPQTFNVYGTSSSNNTVYERMFAKYNTTDVAFQIGTETAGATLRPLEFVAGGLRSMVVTALGRVAVGDVNPSTRYPSTAFEVVKSGIINGPLLCLRSNIATTVGSWSSIAFGDQSQSGSYLKGALIYETTSSVANGKFHIALNNAGGSENATITDARLTVLPSGNVGIGTTAPSEKLHVVGNAQFDATSPYINLKSSTSGLSYYIQSNSNVIGTGSGDYLAYLPPTGKGHTWTEGSTTRMMIQPTTGNVGIGTTSPTSKLHVAGSSSPSITVDNTLATGASQLLFKNTVVTGDTDGIFLNGSTQTGFGGAGSLNIKATTGPIAFHTTSVTNALSIAQNGVATFAGSVTGTNLIATNYIGVPAGNGLVPNAGGGSDFIKIGSNGGSELVRFGYFGTAATSYISFGGVAVTSPALKRSSTTIQARLANDSDFAPIQGKLTTETAFTATTVVPTGFITLYDSTGTAYKVPCVQA